MVTNCTLSPKLTQLDVLVLFHQLLMKANFLAKCPASLFTKKITKNRKYCESLKIEPARRLEFVDLVERVRQRFGREARLRYSRELTVYTLKHEIEKRQQMSFRDAE